ncbi:hypothetical protein [Fontivita pretiosa]|uniref:hypothetical protein n=1 Tax=Fontivita pretiosa TaxID=2989684 RepID=UPI003D16D86E
MLSLIHTCWTTAINSRLVGFDPARNLLDRMLNDPGFWDRKLRIAILTLATFAALC